MTSIQEDIQVTMESPYKLLCRAGEKALSVDIGIHPRLDGSAAALVYFPLKARWDVPFGQEPVPAPMTDRISDRIEEMLCGMGYKVTFCLPMGMRHG